METNNKLCLCQWGVEAVTVKYGPGERKLPEPVPEHLNVVANGIISRPQEAGRAVISGRATLSFSFFLNTQFLFL